MDLFHDLRDTYQARERVPNGSIICFCEEDKEPNLFTGSKSHSDAGGADDTVSYQGSENGGVSNGGGEGRDEGASDYR